MSSLIQKLPGISLPVPEVMRSIAHMWEFDSPQDAHKYSEFRATQMNLIVHFGVATSEEEAMSKFADAVELAQQYPCRIVVLCPDDSPNREAFLQAKLYSQCYIGESHKHANCCEALILSYPPGESNYLENQISIWLDNDLPTYHWFHKVQPPNIEKHYLKFLNGCQRVIFDSSIENTSFADIPWPKDQIVQDLANCRTLNAKQTIGQFLSTYEPSDLINELNAIHIYHSHSLKGEAHSLLQWLKACVADCNKTKDTEPLSFSLTTTPKEDPACFRLEWVYNNHSFFKWTYCLKSSHARIQSNISGIEVDYSAQVQKTISARVLADAILY